MKYYITGVPGSGKSTTAEELKKFDFAVYDIDAIEGLCHWRHKVTKELATYNTGVGKDWSTEADGYDYTLKQDLLR